MSNTFALMFSGTLVIDQPAVVAAAVAVGHVNVHETKAGRPVEPGDDRVRVAACDRLAGPWLAVRKAVAARSARLAFGQR